MAKYYRYIFPRGFSCPLEIRQSKKNTSQYDLYGSGKVIGSYDSPEDAAYAVHMRNTGYEVLDKLRDKDHPRNPDSLDDWEELDD